MIEHKYKQYKYINKYINNIKYDSSLKTSYHVAARKATGITMANKTTSTIAVIIIVQHIHFLVHL